MRRNGSRGVTLIELFFGLGLVAVLAGLAAPGWRSALRAGAVRSATFELMAGLQQTRARSIVEARPGILCLSDSAGNCLGTEGPASAWASFLDVKGSPVPLAGRSLGAGVTLRASRPQLTFWPDARAASTGTLTICDTQGVAAPRAIVLSQTGRARLEAPVANACR